MRKAGRTIRAAALGGAAASLLLLLPLPLPPEGAVGHAVAGWVHLALSAGLAWLVGRTLPDAWRGFRLWIALASFAAAMECLQPWVGRSAEGSDWFYGILGAAGVCATWRWRRRWRVAVVLALGVLPPLGEGVPALQEARAFPILMQPGARWSARAWSLNGIEIAATGAEGLVCRPVPQAEAVAYPGLFRRPVHADWSGIRTLHVRLDWPESMPAVFAVRVDDRPGNPPYADRFQKEFVVTQGWNRVDVSAAELAQASGGRPLHMDRIAHWGVFLVSDVPFDYFSVGIVHVELQEEQP